MRYQGLIALAAFLAACTPAGMAPPTAPIPVTPEVSSPAPAAPGAAVAPAGAPAAAAPEETTQVELEGEVLAPAGVHAAGAAAPAGLWLLAAGEKPVAKAPVQILDPITNKVLGETKTDDAGRYKLTLGVKVAQGGKTLQVSVDAIGPNGRPFRLMSFTRVQKAEGTTAKASAKINTATTALARQLMLKPPETLEDRFILSDFVAAATRLDAALRSEDLDALDLSDPVALSTVLKEIAEGDETLGSLVDKLDGGEDGGDDGEDGSTSSGGSGGSGGGGSNDDDDDVDADPDATDVDEDPDDEEPTTRTPILSGKIQ